MKKKFRTIPVLILFILVCLVITKKDGISQKSFKGFELNSWRPATGVWHFSLLRGTNYKKSIEEITDPKVTIVGVDNLKKKLSELPKGEYVSWLNYAKEPVPKKMVKDLSEYSKTIGITLILGNI